MKTFVSILLACELFVWNLAFATQPCQLTAVTESQQDVPALRTVDIGNGITLHYVDRGKGTPVLFVHGSLSDGGYWADQVGQFAKHHRAISYSRRYNYPNDNPARTGYPAVLDAADLAAFIHALTLRRAAVI